MKSEDAGLIEQIRAAAVSYFQAWNEQDGAKLGDTLRDDVRLTDWEISAHGKPEVLLANSKIWKDFPRVAIAVENIIIGRGSAVTATCEIIVELNDESCTSLKVVDVIVFDEKNKIRAIRAYKQ